MVVGVLTSMLVSMGIGRQVKPTLRVDRIFHENAKEFPDVQVESRKVLKKKEAMSGRVLIM